MFDSCLFLPASSSQSNADSSPEPQQDATQVVWLLLCSSSVIAWVSWRPLCKGGHYFITLDFEIAPLLLPLGISVSFALLSAWKCISAAIFSQEAEGGRGCNCRQVPFQKSYSFFLLLLLHPDAQDTLFCTPDLLQRRSDPSLRLPQEVYYPSFRLYLFKMGSLVTSRDLRNIRSVNSHHLLLSSTCCSAHPCRSPWWRICFHSGLCEMCISLYSAPGLRCKIQLVGRLWYFMWLAHSDLLQELAEEVKVWSPKMAARF